MPSLIDVKKSIEATQSTKKITKAMQLVAASKMKFFQKTTGNVRAYTLGLIRNLSLSHMSMSETKYAEQREDGKVMFVLLTSDKGLCGAMNQQLIRKLFRSKKWKGTPEAERMLVTIGRKSKDAARIEGVTPTRSFERLNEKMTPYEALEVIDALMESWHSGEAKEIVIASPWYVNPFIFHSQLKTYLPFSAEMVKEHLPADEKEPKKAENAPDEASLFEPEHSEVAETLAEQVVQNIFIEAFYELKATEYSSRMVAMKKATEAADERVKTLTLQYNKARQGAITQQLAELASASEAMAGEDAYEIFEA